MSVSEETLIDCPLYRVADITPCDPVEIEPLIAHLQTDQSVAEPTPFPRGTVLEDGRLDLCKQDLGPGGCRMVTEALAANTTITSLLLGTDGIGNAGAADVARLIERNAHLEIVYLGCNKISGSGVSVLADTLTQNRSVQGLWLKRNPVGPTGAQALAKMLRHNRTLRTLDLVNTYPGKEGLAALLEALCRENRTVQRLYLGGNTIDADDAYLLADLLRANPMIRALMLSVNALGDAGARILAEALHTNRTLVELSVASNGITARGASALFAAAESHPTLTHLDFSCSPSTRVLGASPNRLGDAGAEAAANFIAVNCTLLQIDLRHNGITPEGKALLVFAMERNTTLRELRLDGKPMPELVALLERNLALQTIPPLPIPRDVTLIRSVYRTVPKPTS